KELMIMADGGGSNGSRVRLWKLELQGLADELNLPIRVCHFPPGTSKWNKIEHRLFSYISMNWRGRPLVSHEVIVNLIAATTTS
ncbi:ISAzo13 family transposase, partial [Acidithiobacillus ferrivorans]|nr:ISAzo13 family transposase [Acidithiobacillus ferrivorans]